MDEGECAGYVNLAESQSDNLTMEKSRNIASADIEVDPGVRLLQSPA